MRLFLRLLLGDIVVQFLFSTAGVDFFYRAVDCPVAGTGVLSGSFFTALLSLYLLSVPLPSDTLRHPGSLSFWKLHNCSFSLNDFRGHEKVAGGR